MTNRKIHKLVLLALLCAWLQGCNTLREVTLSPKRNLPSDFGHSTDTTTVALWNWKTYFDDPYLIELIDSALHRNQELNITLQEIEISKAEIRARKGEYLPFVGLRAGAGIDKVGKYTRDGAVEEHLTIMPERKFPEPLPDFMAGAFASWELDIWKKLRNGKKAATLRYLASVEGRNFMVTNLVAEIADAYYELLALDNQLKIIEQNITIQSNALNIVRQQKEAAKLSQLAVNRFEAQLLNTKSLQYEVRQRIVEAENRLNFLTGRYPQPIPRASESFTSIPVNTIAAGVPSQLLKNRPDIRKAELEMEAAGVEVAIAKANFYPSLAITGGVGFNSFSAAHLIKPESVLFGLAGDLAAPLINRNAIRAAYSSATASRKQQVYAYEQTVLNAFVEVSNQLAKIDNSEKSYVAKSQEAAILNQSVSISESLFRSARADYLEVLLTQREALESRMELIEIKLDQLNARVMVYKALGGGWR